MGRLVYECLSQVGPERGVIAYSVSRRTTEIGVRVALGATSANMLRRVVSAGMTPALIGIGAGIGIALWGSRVLSALLFETNRLDLFTFLAAPGLLLLVAALACLVPAWRAITLDPVRALRSEQLMLEQVRREPSPRTPNTRPKLSETAMIQKSFRAKTPPVSAKLAAT